MVDEATARDHGICPRCEGYGGNRVAGDCRNVACTGSCSSCWCPGCHDGAVSCDLDPEERSGSWAAYVVVQAAPSLNPHPDQLGLEL